MQRGRLSARCLLCEPPAAAPQAALDDFRDRITRYEEVYETITNRDLHYIKLIDMCPPPPLPRCPAPAPVPCLRVAAPPPAAIPSRLSSACGCCEAAASLASHSRRGQQDSLAGMQGDGKGYMDVNRISGYIPGKIVFFLMQARAAAQSPLAGSRLAVHLSTLAAACAKTAAGRGGHSAGGVRGQVCKAGLSRMRKIWLTRHGQSMSNTHELLGGDSHLSPRGAVYAKKLPDVLIDRVPLVPPPPTSGPPWSTDPALDCCAIDPPAHAASQLAQCDLCLWIFGSSAILRVDRLAPLPHAARAALPAFCDTQHMIHAITKHGAGGCAQTSHGGIMPVSVWTSTLTRTIETAEQIPFPKLRWKVRSPPC